MKNYQSKEIGYFINGLQKDFNKMTRQEKLNYYSFLTLKSIYDKLCENDKGVLFKENNEL